jgi:hypothetical protein
MALMKYPREVHLVLPWIKVKVESMSL